MYYAYPEEDLPSYLLIFTITVFAVEKLDCGVLFKKHVNPVFVEKKTIGFIVQMIGYILIKRLHLINKHIIIDSV